MLLRKVIHPYEYMNTWKRFNETLLPEKEYFCSNLNMEDITDPNYKQAKKVWYDFEIKNLGYDYDLYVQTIRYYLQIYLETFGINLFKYMNLIDI